MQTTGGTPAKVSCVAEMSDGSYTARIYDLTLRECEGRYMTPVVQFGAKTKVTMCGNVSHASKGDTLELAVPLDTAFGRGCFPVLVKQTGGLRVLSRQTAKSFNVHLEGDHFSITWDHASRRL